MFSLGTPVTVVFRDVATAALITNVRSDVTYDLIAFPADKAPIGIESVPGAALSPVAQTPVAPAPAAPAFETVDFATAEAATAAADAAAAAAAAAPPATPTPVAPVANAAGR